RQAYGVKPLQILLLLSSTELRAKDNFVCPQFRRCVEGTDGTRRFGSIRFGDLRVGCDSDGRWSRRERSLTSFASSSSTY
ncbi:MAG: hypothetical protein WBL43_05585, partial [Pseudolabrys sp.]